MKGAGFYLSGWLNIFETYYPAKVTELNARSGDEFSGEMASIQFFSSYEEEVAAKHPALYVLPREGKIVEAEEQQFAYEFELIVVLVAKSAANLMRDLAEHELAVSEIVSERWALQGVTSGLIDQVNYDSARQRGTALMGELRLGLFFQTHEPRRFLTGGTGGNI